MTAPFRPHTHCRVCGSASLRPYLDLGEQPLANDFRAEGEPASSLRVPLVLTRCTTCGLSQLGHVVDPDVLYRHYHYESGHSAGWRAHCDALAAEIAGMPDVGLVCDIACNDGVLLRACQERELLVFGVEPALNIPVAGGIPVERQFWGEETAQDCVDKYGHTDVIVAQNVLGHVHDVQDFLRGIAVSLDVGGVAIIECPHIGPLLEQVAFDTVYHEHLSYWSLGPLTLAARQAGLLVTGVKTFPELHGGTVRYYLRLQQRVVEIVVPDRYDTILAWEEIAAAPESYAAFTLQVEATRNRLLASIALLAQQSVGDPLVAYGASAKSTVLFNYLGAEFVRDRVTALYDDSPAKQGRYAPGTALQVEALPADCSTIGTALVTAPNWYPQMRERLVARGFRGAFLLPWNGGTVERCDD